ncbi:hypothetical protein MCHI_001673 [Candidatus Magnetoovum chiemensis]|nr:hypothetical protein MCHI_001673 [Candidatus Magnetoovum chiemensis]
MLLIFCKLHIRLFPASLYPKGSNLDDFQLQPAKHLCHSWQQLPHNPRQADQIKYLYSLQYHQQLRYCIVVVHS